MTMNTECDRHRLALRVKWWQGEKFGMFIHWGLYAIPGRGEWVMFHERIRCGEYEKLMRHFRPRPGMARQWARLARQAGMRYMVLTTKHHDGFCLFDTKLTDYNAVNSAARRDLVREYVEACRAENLRVGLYYSIRDWHHPNYPVVPQDRLAQSDPGARRPDLQKYLRYMRGQLKELLTNYGKIDILWFDGRDPVFNDHEADGKIIAKEIREYQPDILINNRLFGNDPDFVTPEQTTPREPPRIDGREVPWEVCHTLTGMWWGYCRHEREEDLRTAGKLISMLSAAAGMGGNFMLNVGPRPDGTLPPMVTQRLQAMGAWMRKYGDSIYGTVAGPACHPDYGSLTRKGNDLYLHVFEWPRDGRLPLPAVSQKPVRAALMNGKSLPVRNNCVMAPRRAPNAEDSVIVLTFRSPPSCKPARRLPHGKGVDYHVIKGGAIAVNADIGQAVWRKPPVIQVSQDTHFDESLDRYPGPARHGYCAYSVRAMHANGLLYVAVDVESPTRLVRPEAHCMVNCDAVRMFFAANTGLSICNYTPESFELSIDAMGGVWMPREAEFPGAVFRHAVAPTDRGYTVMLAMPLGMMRRKADDHETALKPGDRFRFNIMVSQPTPLPAHRKTVPGRVPKRWWLSPDFDPRQDRHQVWWKGSGGELWSDLWTDVQSWGLWQLD